MCVKAIQIQCRKVDAINRPTVVILGKTSNVIIVLPYRYNDDKRAATNDEYRKPFCALFTQGKCKNL